ncbi:DNA polymerase III subunit gamma and tau [Arthrobacter sp. Sa2CUA1]|uniref:DNA-directed DNA polymerase n=1 Tax=Arthrobacter gallicola TaxID=2762225 RepID=A0ABR8UR98_9MICC|nr:DNA polymerase III subunit gamma and tau [Arthrobacter gallicola]MBD7995077.1 DNA polymerase III subunit gamma and tau [Arthrobacter gallicola]
MSTALYRRYRPENFGDVIGQEHVTEPLMAALSKNRVNHAYLFSGPRGCGKTTSARILARCLNCAEGPTPTPCGKCDSCVELARNGSGSLDVIEIDAASHGGVDDARDLRERATFAPVRDRYKIFIIDEAHMVTSAGFNALLKIVEEPPEHIKFIFATTEPDKVIGTIRSRTHHYPFRLVPPEPLLAYLDKLCGQENVPVAPGVLSLVIRAGGGSVRDSLSVLDQLMAGAGESGLDYELAVNLLGYTHVALLDDVVDAFAAGDATTVFSAIDRVIQTGQDPRRFVEDLLERFRDLIVVNAMPDSAAAVLRGVPEDQISRMHTQAAQFGGAELSRAADITNTALTEMTGATSPRLHLELLCARILLPAADQSERGTAARVDRLERRLSYAGDGAPAYAGGESGQGAPASVPAAERPTAARRHAAAAPAASQPASQPEAPQPAPVEPAPAAADWGGTWATPAPAVSSPAPVQPASDTSAAPGGSNRTWDDVSREAAEQQTSGQPAPVPARNTPDVQGSHSWTSPNGGAEAPAGQASTGQASAPAAPRQQPQNGPGASGDTAPAPQTWQSETPSGVVSTQSGAGSGQPGTPATQSGAMPSGQSGVPATQSGAPGTNGQPAPAGGSQPASPAPQEAGRNSASGGGSVGGGASGGGGQIEMIRRAWPEIMDALTSIRRATWLNVSKNASPRAFDGRVLELAFSNPGAATNFNRPDHLENLRKAIHQVLGVDCQVNAVHDSTAAAGEPGPKAGSRPNPPAQVPAPAPQQPTAGAPAPVPASAPTHASAAPFAAPPAQRGGHTVPAAAVHAGAAPVWAGPAGAEQAAAMEHAAGQHPSNLTNQRASQPRPAHETNGQPPAGAATAADRPAAAPSREAESEARPEARPQAQGPDARETAHSDVGRAPGTAAQPASGVGPTGASGPARPAPDASGSGSSQPASGAGPTRSATGTSGPARPAPDASGSGPSQPAPGAGPTRPAPGTSGPARRAPDASGSGPSQPAPGASEPSRFAGPAGRPSASSPAKSRPAASRPAAPLPDDWPQEPSDPADMPESNAWETAAPPDDIHVSSAVSDDEWANTNWAGTTATRPAGQSAGAGWGQTPGRQMTSQNSPAGAPSGTSAGTPAAQGSARGTSSPRAQAPVQTAPQPARSQPAETPAAPGSGQGNRPLSRYQKLLNEAAQRNGTAQPAAGRGNVDLGYIEDVPSADDVTLEDSGLVGRKAIERILGGRLIEERSLDGQDMRR